MDYRLDPPENHWADIVANVAYEFAEVVDEYNAIVSRIVNRDWVFKGEELDELKAILECLTNDLSGGEHEDYLEDQRRSVKNALQNVEDFRTDTENMVELEPLSLD